MKKLGKLSINSDRVMNNEELVNLRGGDYYYSDCIFCTVEYESGAVSSGYCCDTQTNCLDALNNGDGVKAAWC